MVLEDGNGVRLDGEGGALMMGLVSLQEDGVGEALSMLMHQAKPGEPSISQEEGSDQKLNQLAS